MIIFKNELVEVERRDDKICWYDLTDHLNDFKGFTQNKRYLDKATELIGRIANGSRAFENKKKEDVNMGDITHILQELKLKPHTYCGMD